MNTGRGAIIFGRKETSRLWLEKKYTRIARNYLITLGYLLSFSFSESWEFSTPDFLLFRLRLFDCARTERSTISTCWGTDDNWNIIYTTWRMRRKKKCFCADLQRSTYIYSLVRESRANSCCSLSLVRSLKFYASLCCIYAQINSLFLSDLYFDVHNLVHGSVNQNRRERKRNCSRSEREWKKKLENLKWLMQGRTSASQPERDENFTIFCHCRGFYDHTTTVNSLKLST